MTAIAQGVRRVLVIDDNPEIHNDIKKILQPTTRSDDFDALLSDITGKTTAKTNHSVLQVDSAFQGDEGIKMIRQARMEERPYALAFVDMRIPPGLDGLQTIKKMQMEDDRLQYIIITAYSDYSWQDISDSLVSKDNLLVIKKPFESIEIRQSASALIEKWHIAMEREHILAALAMQRDMLEDKVKERTAELDQKNVLLEKGIEERKKAEEQIRRHRDMLEKEVARRSARIVEQNNFLHTVINSLPHPFMVVNVADYTVAVANKATLERRTRGGCIPEEEKCYQCLYGFHRPCHEQGLPCPLQSIRSQKESLGQPVVLEHSVLDDQGNECILEVNTHPVATQQQEGKQGEKQERRQVIEYCIDITHRKKMEATLLRNSKMELVATLAGGIAHDFNNLLMGIVGNIELAAMNIEQGHSAAGFLCYATEASAQAKELTHKFLLFSNFDPPARQAVPLNDLITNSCMATFAGSHIVPEFHFAEDLWMGYIDPGQLDLALRELFLNAREAMDTQGNITLTAENITYADENHPGHPGRSNGRYIKITLEDQGVGIDRKDLINVFDPYFSTKVRGNGKGMGLGLTIASSIIHQHQGYVDIKSTLGKGTTVYIELLAAPDAPDAPEDRPE
ncbi:MAG: response regulator [Candidatus Electrothrix sp. AW1]|nr:response regulator [Candidatus Electrothrix sp. AX1]MCI5181792.1 response regulator [Candidatus Electrothrix gigas]